MLTLTTSPDSTTAAVQDNPSVDQQNAAAAALAPDFNAITSALTSATTLLAKRAWEDTVIFARTGGDDKDGGHGGGKDGPNKSCAKECLLVKIELLVWEIACTIKLVIIKLGLGKLSQLDQKRGGSDANKGNSLRPPDSDSVVVGSCWVDQGS